MTSVRRGFAAGMVQEVALGYAWIVLTPSWKAGAVLALVTAFEPVQAMVGLLAAISAWLAALFAGAQAAERPVAVFNGLLIGLLVAHGWEPGTAGVALAVLGGVWAGWLSVVLGRMSASLARLPVLSLPFSLVAMLTAAASGSLSTLQLHLYAAPAAWLNPAMDAFLGAFGGLYFNPDPVVGALVLGVLLVFSRYYLLLAALGFGAAALCMQMLDVAPEHLQGTGWIGNAVLSALLVGGLFAVPSVSTAALATLAAVFAAWLSLCLARMLEFAHLLPYALPFVMAVWLVLYAAFNNVRLASLFHADTPDFPERSHERACIARARTGHVGSVPLALPFCGEWTVSQGFSGEHTHRGVWRHALDFMVLRAGKSFAGRGNRLEDFYCYGQPVLSPAYGQVWSVVGHVADNTPGTVNAVDNWGNYVVIRLADGKFVLVAHLRPGTLAVEPGAWLQPGDLLGECGNSGRSPQPHIHMHVQATAQVGSVTAPFHLSNVMVAQDDGTAHYELAWVPSRGTVLSAAPVGDAKPFHVSAGHGLRYRVSRAGQALQDWSVHCEVDLLGRLQLVSSRGARCFVESTWAVFSCFGRDAVPDEQFDVWLLACGYTPSSTGVEHWQEHCTPARLLPDRLARCMGALAWPLATYLHSHYQRQWDAQARVWRQTASHRQVLTGRVTRVEAVIVPQLGCTAITAGTGRLHYVFQATDSFQRGDLGVPAWEAPLPLTPAKA